VNGPHGRDTAIGATVGEAAVSAAGEAVVSEVAVAGQRTGGGTPAAPGTAGTSLVEIEDLRIQFRGARGDVLAVNDLSLRLGENEVLAVVGESGCGKTVTGLAMLGLEPPGAQVDGSVRFRGEDLRAADPRRLRSVRGREIAMIFQEPMTSLNPAFSIGYQVAEVLRQHQGLRGRRARDRVAELLELVGMPSPGQRLRQYPHQLSGGMRQRVMIAMGIACDPAILIADEPTTALDPTIQAQILDLLRELRTTLSMSVLLITHNLGVVADIADRVLVMYAGHKIEEAPVAGIFSAPQHPYTAGLLNAVPQPGASRDTRPLTAIAGQVPLLRQAPGSCVFASRCPLVTEECMSGQPPLREVHPRHLVACVRAGELTAEGGPV
jgi:peptide/nickel transport system ATP-binding protein